MHWESEGVSERCSSKIRTSCPEGRAIEAEEVNR